VIPAVDRVRTSATYWRRGQPTGFRAALWRVSIACRARLPASEPSGRRRAFARTCGRSARRRFMPRRLLVRFISTARSPRCGPPSRRAGSSRPTWTNSHRKDSVARVERKVRAPATSSGCGDRSCRAARDAPVSIRPGEIDGSISLAQCLRGDGRRHAHRRDWPIWREC